MKKVIQTAIAAINKNSVRRPTCHRLALDLLTAGMLVSGSFNQGDLSDKGLFSDASKLRLYRQELEIELERNRNELLLVGAGELLAGFDPKVVGHVIVTTLPAHPVS